jgi:hypothetical protein
MYHSLLVLYITASEEGCIKVMLHCFALLQRFQQRKYIKHKLVKTKERGWGLLADADVKVVLSSGCMICEHFREFLIPVLV